MSIVRVNLGPRSYDIAIDSGVADRFAEAIREQFPRAVRFFVVADTNTCSHAERLCGRLPGHVVAVIPAGESSKSLAMAGELYSRLAHSAADRRTPVIAVGGGVVGDLAGFVAATYNRGLPLIMVPTTLLAMVDSSVGGKVGINLSEGKNLVGAFHQPASVWIDIEFLQTLPEREYRSGLAEVVKYGAALDVAFFDWLEKNADAVLRREAQAIAHVVARCCRLKADVVEQDEREETGRRMVLNYGHTFAHAFESIGGYGAWLHGEAVAAGMVCASRLAESRGLIGSEPTSRQVELLHRFGLPTRRDPAWNVHELLSVMKRDKKNVAGRLRFILPTRLGQVEAFDDVSEAQVIEVLSVP
jgi:3-dehydroquinate synthase